LDINHSRWDCTLEPTRNPKRYAVRLGLRLVAGLKNAEAAMIPLAQADQPFTSIEDLWRRARISVTALERLADADAFGSIRMSRRDALWIIRGLSDEPLSLFAAADERDSQIQPEGYEPQVELTPMTEGREVVEDYRSKGLTLRQHPISFLREELRHQRIHRCSAIRMMRDGRRLTVAGMVLVRQKPGSAKGVMFMTIEDETDVVNLVIWPSLFEKQRRLILSSGMIGCRGRLQKEGGVIHVVAEHIVDLSHLLRSVGDRDQPFEAEHGRGDEARLGTRDILRQGARDRDGELPVAQTNLASAAEIRFTARNFH
jgi:error-prone DNA polymerase